MAIEMTDEEYEKYTKKQKEYQESEEGQRELASAKEAYAKREALEKKWKEEEEEPINDTDSETSVEHTAFHEVAETAHEEHENLKDKKKKYPEPDAYMSEVYRKRAEKEQKEKTTADIYASQDKEMAESFFGGKTKAQVEAEMPAGSRGKYGTVGTKPLGEVKAETDAFNNRKKSETRSTRSINTEFQDMDLSPQGRKDVEEIKQKIKRGDDLPPILVSKSGHLQDGRHRLKAYQELGIDEVPVTYGNHPAAKVTEKKQPSNVQEDQYKTKMFADEETRQSHVPIKSSSFEDTIVKAKKFGKTGNTTDFASTAQTTTQVPKREPAQQPFGGGDPYSEMNRDTEKQNTAGIDFEEVSKSNELAAKKKQIADYQKTQPSMDAEIEAKRKENRDKKTLEDYKNNRGAVGKAMDMFSRTHTQEMGYAAEKKVEGYLTKRREEKKLENKKRIEQIGRAHV